MSYKKVQPTQRAILADPRVQYISDERATGEGIWIYLKTDFVNTFLECSMIHERTLKDCVQQLNHHVCTRDEWNAFIGKNH